MQKLQDENVIPDNVGKQEESEPQANSTEKPKPTIIDECSTLRHQIITRTHAIGCPKEHPVHPANTEAERGELGLFTDFISAKKRPYLLEFLDNTFLKSHDANWLSNARRAYKSSRFDDIEVSFILVILFIDIIRNSCKTQRAVCMMLSILCIYVIR